MKLFKLYLGGHNFNGWYSGILVTFESLERINDCKKFRGEHLPNYATHKITYLQPSEEYEYQWNGTIVWEDTFGISWTMEITLSEQDVFL
jgi:hypothetical protein